MFFEQGCLRIRISQIILCTAGCMTALVLPSMQSLKPSHSNLASDVAAAQCGCFHAERQGMSGVCAEYLKHQ